MQLGMIGLGRMGGNLVRRLVRAGHQCVVYDRSGTGKALAGPGVTVAASLEDFAKKLSKPRAACEGVVGTLSKLFEKDDVIIDGGNSYYRDDIARAAKLKPRGIHFVDV